MVIEHSADHVGLAEVVVEYRAIGQHQIAANGQGACGIACSARRQDAAVIDRDTAAEGADAAQGRAGLHGRQPSGGRLVAVDQQCASRQACRTGVAIVASQRRGAGAALRPRAATGDDTAVGIGVRAIEHQRTVVDYVARTQRASGPAIANLQRASIDDEAAGGAAGSSQHQGTGIGFP
ncbi:hypothetical protein D3C77_225580 [compost metagenome]